MARQLLQRPIERPAERPARLADRASKSDRAGERMAMAVPPARPAARAEPPAEQLKDRPADRLADHSRMRPGEAGAGAPPPARVAEAQRLLTRLGHDPGDADGVYGSRTEEAVRAFQRRMGAAADGRISDGLVARLRHDVQEVAARDDRRAPTPAGGRVAASPGLMGTILAHIQRVVGPTFNGVRRPDQLRAYCREQPETWIFDEGRGDLVFCGTYAGLADEHRQRAQR